MISKSLLLTGASIVLLLLLYLSYYLSKNDNKIEEVVNVEHGYYANVKVPSSDVEVLRVTSYKSDGTIRSLYLIKYKKVGFCTTGNGTAMRCDFFEKFKKYRQL